MNCLGEGGKTQKTVGEQRQLCAKGELFTRKQSTCTASVLLGCYFCAQSKSTFVHSVIDFNCSEFEIGRSFRVLNVAELQE